MQRSKIRDSNASKHISRVALRFVRASTKTIRDTYHRHHRACPGGPRLRLNDAARKDVDGRVKPGHDE